MTRRARPSPSGPSARQALAGALGLVAFVVAVGMVLGDAAAVGLERGLTRWARGLPASVIDVVRLPDALGSIDGGIIVAAVAAVLLGPTVGLRVIASVLLVAEASPALKQVFDRPRLSPDALGALPLVDVGSSPAYPSSHAAVAFAVATALLLVHRRVGGAALVVATVVAFGRMAAGVHTVADVVGGAALGAAVALVVHAAALVLGEAIRRRRQADGRTASTDPLPTET